MEGRRLFFFFSFFPFVFLPFSFSFLPSFPFPFPFLSFIFSRTIHYGQVVPSQLSCVIPKDPFFPYLLSLIVCCFSFGTKIFALPYRYDRTTSRKKTWWKRFLFSHDVVDVTVAVQHSICFVWFFLLLIARVYTRLSLYDVSRKYIKFLDDTRLVKVTEKKITKSFII